MSVGGIDVSTFQGSIGWTAVAEAGVKFALARATMDVSATDGHFARNWAGLKAAGIIRGAYHVFHPESDPLAQADHFLATAQPGAGDLPPALDVEIRGKVDVRTFLRRMAQWVDRIARATGHPPLIYVSPSFWESLGSPPGFSANPLWIAEYGRKSPMIPRGWSTYTFWQYSSSGRVSNLDPVDLDVFNGTLPELTSFVATGQAPSTGRVSDGFAHEGDTGPAVEEIQTLLRAKGFDPGVVDGIFGPRTKSAVVSFQQVHNLIVDGIVGPQTLHALQE